MGKYPSYLNLSISDLYKRSETAFDMMKGCCLCPRRCGVDRTKGQRGFCRTDDHLFVSSWGPHFGEERPITGLNGSGTIFFGNCNLGCVFCQNYSISQEGEGMAMTEEALAEVMIGLQDRGCHNINLVTPTHQLPMILRSLAAAVERGLCLPIVYNCGGYESLEAVRLLEGIVDIYMPDIKFSAPEISSRLADAEDYFQRAKEVVKEMHRQTGDLTVDSREVALRGLLVRHLVLPLGMAGSQKVFRFLSREVSPKTYVNIMDQYYPCYKARQIEGLNRRITRGEYVDAFNSAMEAGLLSSEGGIYEA